MLLIKKNKYKIKLNEMRKMYYLLYTTFFSVLKEIPKNF
jgi:hypothetical protein